MAPYRILRLLFISMLFVCQGFGIISAHDFNTISYAKIEIVDNQVRFINLVDSPDASHLFFAGYPEIREEIHSTILVYNNDNLCPLSNFLNHSENKLSTEAYYFVAICDTNIEHLTIIDAFPLEDTLTLVYTIVRNTSSLVLNEISPAVFTIVLDDNAELSGSSHSLEVNIADIAGNAEANNLNDAQTDSSQKNLWQLFITYLMLGLEHILSGLDHIAFILGYILLATSLGALLKGVSGFTLSHSLTLTLSALAIFSISPIIIEPLIALSIAIVGVLAIFNLVKKWLLRFGIIFLFGLFHGLGFAGAISEVGFPKEGFVTALLGFNIGIELGQLMIVFAIFPILASLRERFPNAHTYIHKVLAIAISLGGLIWFVQRL